MSDSLYYLLLKGIIVSMFVVHTKLSVCFCIAILLIISQGSRRLLRGDRDVVKLRVHRRSIFPATQRYDHLW